MFRILLEWDFKEDARKMEENYILEKISILDSKTASPIIILDWRGSNIKLVL